MKIALIREGKVPSDRRVPLTPIQARQLMDTYSGLKVVAQSSDIRCFSDQEYKDQGIELTENVDDCDVLLGVKEVPIEKLISDKTYFFFSHTIKAQAYNRELLRAILKRNIRLIDYEILTNTKSQRLVAFGRYAGIVGAYNGILTYGKKHKLFELRRAYTCFDLADMQTEFTKVKLPPIKIVVTGSGRVAKGAMEVLTGMGIKKVSQETYLNESFSAPVFTQAFMKDYHIHKDGRKFVSKHFYDHPEQYEGDFEKYLAHTDILIAGAFWDPAAPVLFSRKDMLKENFRINVIADITCDIEGSIPSTKKPSTIEDPFYDYDAAEDRICDAFSNLNQVTVMAVDNLPCELPRNASQDFGHELLNNVLPALIDVDPDRIIERATIAQNGKLTTNYAYLQSFVEG